MRVAGYSKKTSARLIFLLVDYDEKFWNTFFDIILGWEPVLRQTAELDNGKNDDLNLSQ